MEIIKKIILKSILSFLLCLSTVSLIFADEIMVLNSSDKYYGEASRGIIDAAEDKYTVHSVTMTDAYDVTDLKNEIEVVKPDFIILIGNKAAINYYRYQKENHNSKRIPAVIIASIFTDRLIEKMDSTIGVRYEVPIPIIVSQYRYHTKGPVNNIGIVYRGYPWMKEFIKSNVKYAQLEQVNLKTYEIPTDASAQNIRYHFMKMVKDDIDAVWILNDSYLINMKTIGAIIKPIIDRSHKPVLVNSDALVNKEVGLGTFSLVPDMYGLGIQSINTINTIDKVSLENDISLEEATKLHPKLVEPISTIKSINLDQAVKKGINVYQERLIEIDKVIE